MGNLHARANVGVLACVAAAACLRAGCPAHLGVYAAWSISISRIILAEFADFQPVVSATIIIARAPGVACGSPRASELAARISAFGSML
jgi:hypothetical protein